MTALTTLRALIDAGTYLWADRDTITVHKASFTAIPKAERSTFAAAIAANKPDILTLLKTTDNTDVLHHRLSRAVDILWHMERCGDWGTAYRRILNAYITLLCHYETLCNQKEAAA